MQFLEYFGLRLDNASRGHLSLSPHTRNLEERVSPKCFLIVNGIVLVIVFKILIWKLETVFFLSLWSGI